MTTITGKMVLVLALAVGLIGLTVATQIAGASHVRPKSATPLRVPLVPAFKECTSPNRMHGEPLARGSCNPAVQTSNFLTVGTPDANGAAANSQGFMQLKVVPHMCCPPQDVVISTNISDVRCKPGTATSVCSNANSVGGPDYSGELQGNATLRITDHFNGPNLNEAATVVDIPFPLNYYCVGTSDGSIGGTCTVNTSAVALYPETSNPQLAVVGMTQFQVFDGGPDGQVYSQDNTLFEVQGVFVP
jgi:hypothetical protein